MPGPWRLNTRFDDVNIPVCFNLRRDARPLATKRLKAIGYGLIMFQSQTRCQAPGDGRHSGRERTVWEVSISDEMPGPWRRQTSPPTGRATTRINLRRAARTLAPC